jgi:2'-5' RNA ligase
VPRLRLGVALLVPPPLDREIEGLRRAVGDGSLGRIPPHLTLVPPVNVAADRLEEALAVLRAAAEDTEPFSVELGPPGTFLPDTPVLHLSVQGEGVGELRALRDRVFREPLARSLTWPFVPHVTLAEEARPERIAAALEVLADYRVEVRFDRVQLLREGQGRVWEPIADAPFAPPTVVGRGGLPAELSVAGVADPEVRGLLDRSEHQLVVTARREGRAVGALALALGEGEEALGTAEHLLRRLSGEVYD